MRIILLIAIFWCSALTLKTQVYPGDANLSGRADQHDVLYVGYAYGSAGPARQTPSTVFSEMPIALEWQQAFPDGTSYAHADANGDGQVDVADMLAVVANFGSSHSTPDEVVFPTAVPGMDPTLQFTPDALNPPLTAGSAVTVTIDLEYPFAAQAVNGLAFSINYNKNYIQSISLAVAPDWLGGTSQSFRFQSIDPQQTDQLDVATTRYGQQPYPAAGRVGILSIVIEDDLITFMQADSAEVLVDLSEVMLAGENLELLPANTDSILLTVYNPNFLVSQTEAIPTDAFQCFPNPATGNQLEIRSARPIRRYRLTDMLGRPCLDSAVSKRKQLSVRLPANCPPGTYWLQVWAEGGRINEQLLLIR